MERQRTVRVLIAASGTGGHLFPGVFIARAFQRLSPGVVLEFIGSGRELEEKIIGGAGFKINKISAVGVKHRGIKGLLQTLVYTPIALLQVIFLFIRFRPQVVVGVGGYVTFLPIMAAFLLRIPTWIHEAEIEPGMANKYLSRYANRISLAFQESSLINKNNAVYTGHPVRESISEVTAGLNKGEQPKRILVLGGSQGARALDQVMQNLGPELANYAVEVYHQSRPESISQLEEAYKKSGIKARLAIFIEDMAAAYSWADIIVARSGAGTVMEIGAINRPTLFVPYPHAQGDHQSVNAETLVKVGKALIVKEGDSFQENFKTALLKLLEPLEYHKIKERPYQGRSKDAAHAIASGCLELVLSRPS